jgi:hypothetical protein
VIPARAYTDRAVRVTIRGEGFIPSFQLDPGQGIRRGNAAGFSGRVGRGPGAVALRDFDWLDAGVLTAWLDPGLPEGPQPVEVHDPRGQTVSLPAAFTSLGPDHDRPDVTFLRPPRDAVLAPGVDVAVTVNAADVAPGALSDLLWETHGADLVTSGHCALVPSPADVRCEFEVTVPSTLSPQDVFELAVTATDSALEPNRTRASLLFTVQAQPSLEAIDPLRGGTSGGTDVVVSGAAFVPGTQILIDKVPLIPGGGRVIDGQTIGGRMPPHRAGPVVVTLVSPLGNAGDPLIFVYADPPAIARVDPREGDPAGGTAVAILGARFGAETQVLFGDTLAQAQPLAAVVRLSETEIHGTAPPGRGRTSVWVFDPEVGWDRLPDGFGWRAP